MKLVLEMTYGIAAYVFFLATTLYAILFVGDLGGVRAIDGPSVRGPWASAVIDAALLGLFAVQHSVMARAWFKRRWTRIVPAVVERSTFVVAASALLALTFWQWNPIGGVVWSAQDPIARALLWTFYFLGWAMVIGSTFLLDHFELFGLRQVYDAMRGRPGAEPVLRTPSLYKVVRHPLYLGFVIAFWATPFMTVGHLLFSAASTAYIVAGMFFEERDLVAQFGASYRVYQRRVPALIPWPRRSARDDG